MRMKFLLAVMASFMGGVTTAQGVFYGAKGPETGPNYIRRKSVDVGPLNTGGWVLMTHEERKAHRAVMQSLDSFDECQVYLEEHEEKMFERALEMNETYVEPQVDVCVFMQRRGIFK